VVGVGGRGADRNWAGIVSWNITRPVGIRPLRKIAELVRFIVMAEFEYCRAGHVPDASRSVYVRGVIVRVVAQPLH
jgi:hypothetical protein